MRRVHVHQHESALRLRQVAEAERQKLVVMQQQEQQLRAEQARPLERGEDLQAWAMKRVFLEKDIDARLA